jgi:hypothetical protein
MNLIEKNVLNKELLPGRIIQKAVGMESPVKSQKMTMGFATYCKECGPMTPHHHAEDTVYILKSEGGYVRYGENMEKLSRKIPLHEGMTLHFDELEWHVFEYDEGGEVEIIFFYGQVNNIRPEEIAQNRK